MASPNSSKRKRHQAIEDVERQAQLEELRAEEAETLEDLKWFAQHASVVEFDTTTGRPIRNESFDDPSDLDVIEGLVKITHIPSDLLQDLTTIHDHIKAVNRGRMVSWSGVGGEWDGRLRAFGFPTQHTLRKLDASRVRLHAFEKTGADAEEDEEANRTSICILDDKKDGCSGLGGDENSDSGAGRYLSVDPFDVANRLCNVINPIQAGIPLSIANASQIIAFQPNLHNGARFLKPHLDQPLHEGFGKMIVTIAIRGGGATIVLLDKDENGTTEDGDKYQLSWRFHLCEGEAYILTGRARNLCLHGVIADDPSGVRESLNLRFGIHSVADAKEEIFDHWVEGEVPNVEDCAPYSST